MSEMSMKKMGMVLALALMCLPTLSHAATLSELQAQLQLLMAQLVALQAHTTLVVAPASQSNTTSCPNLVRNLFRGSRGSDVTQLQEFLISQNLLASDSVTGFFGAMTEVAVKQWQSKNNIASSGTPNTTGYGAIGPRTRAALVICAVSMNTQTRSPTYTSPTPDARTTPIQDSSVDPTSPATPLTSMNPTTIVSCAILAPQTQTISCFAGQTGSITQTRTSSCAAGATTPTWGGWTTTTNTCQTAVAAPDASSLSVAAFNANMQIITPAHYSFGSTVDSSGSVYFAEYNRTRLMKYTPGDGRVVAILQNTGGMYGVAADASGNLYVGIDSETNTGKLVRVSQSGSVQTVISGIRRPRQVSIGSDGNVYVVLEADGKIMRWNPSTQQSSTVVEGLKTPQGAVEKNGTLYWIEYGSFGPQGQALAPGRIQKRTSDGTIATILDGIWRGRGLAMRSDGTLIGASEADTQDHGNSGYIFSLVPGGSPVLLAGGLDYPQFPSVSNSGAIYFTLARDNWLAIYTNAPQQSTWPSGQTARWFQGSVLASGGDAVSLTAGNSTLTGSISGGSSGVVKGWVRVPGEQVNTSKAEVSYGTNEVPTPGVFQLPALKCTRDSGAACAAQIVVERAHTGSRWPMDYSTGRELPAPGFSESPVAYWVYLDSDPANAATQRNWSLIAPSLERFLQRHFEGLLRRKASSFAEMSGWFDYIKNSNLECKDISNSFLGTDEWKNGIASLSETQVITYLYQGLLGTDPDQAGLQYSLNLRTQGQPWSRVTDDLMNTSLYSQVCAQDWH